MRPAPFPNRRCQQYPQWLGRLCQTTQNHQRRPAPTAIKTQTLPNCVLLACAYQSARQRNTGIAKRSCQGFWKLFGEGRLFGRPLFKQTRRNYQPGVSTPRTPEQNKEGVNQQNTVYHKIYPRFSSYNLGGTSHEQQWPQLCSVLEKVLRNGKK